jgi:hypothetical protein
MTLRRLVLATAAGMLLTSLTVYLMAPATRVVAATGVSRAAATSGHRDEVAALRAELERLHALLDRIQADSGSGEGKPVQDVQSTQDATQIVESQPGIALGTSAAAAGAKPAPEGGTNALPVLSEGCAVPVPEAAWNRILAEMPQFRQLPPERFELLQNIMLHGSPHCVCEQNQAGTARCVNWCQAKGFPRGTCNAGRCSCG